MRINILQKFLVCYLLLLFVYWNILYFSGLRISFWNYFYSFAFSLIPLIGGFIGLFVSRSWGVLTSAVGKAVFFISAGLFSWGFGSMIWSYYNFFKHIAAPYPSFADIGFVLSIPLWAIGVINLAKATGAKFGLRRTTGKFLLVLIPLLITVISYYLLVVIARGGVVTDSLVFSPKLIFDFIYPLSDVLILTLALIIFGLSFKYFGGQYKLPIFAILSGFAFMYLADFIFSYTTTINTFYNGDYGDLLFTIALSFITFGNLGFFRSGKWKKDKSLT